MNLSERVLDRMGPSIGLVGFNMSAAVITPFCLSQVLYDCVVVNLSNHTTPSQGDYYHTVGMWS